MKAKLVSMMLVLGMTAGLLAGCGGSGDGAADPEPSASGQEDQTGTNAPAEGDGADGEDTGSENAGDGEKITLKLFHNWINVEETPYFEDIAKEFESTHENVDIVIENVGDPDYRSKLKVMLGADEAPDIFFSWSGETAFKFARAGSAMDLTKYFEEDSQWKDSFVQASLTPFSYDGGIYGVPVRIDCKMMVYNKALFEEYNVEVPTTYEEFLAVCETFKQADIIPLALGNIEPWASCHYISTFNSMCVPDDVRTADNNYKTGTFTDPGYVEALNMLKELNDKGYFTPNTNAMDFDMARNDFFIGKAAMTYMQSIEFKRCEENNVDAGVFKIPFPAGAAGNEKLVTGSPDGFMISSTCKHPEIAIEFLKLMTSKPWQERMITQLSSPASVQDVHNAENSNDVTLQAVEVYEQADGFANWLDADIHSKISEIYVPGLQEVIAGTKTPEDLMGEVQAAAKQVQSEEEE